MPRERRTNIGRRTRHVIQQQVNSQNISEKRQNIIQECLIGTTRRTRRSLASYNRLALTLQLILEYNTCFRMTSFGGNIIQEGSFMSTSKVKHTTHITNHSQQRNEDQKKMNTVFIYKWLFAITDTRTNISYASFNCANTKWSASISANIFNLVFLQIYLISSIVVSSISWMCWNGAIYREQNSWKNELFNSYNLFFCIFSLTSAFKIR